MPKALIVVLLCGAASLLSIVLSVIGVTSPLAVLPFELSHAAISFFAACGLLAARLYPPRLALLAVGLAIFTLGVGLLDLALAAVSVLDAGALSASSLAGGVVFSCQGLLSLRGLRVTVVRDPPGGPGPLSPA